jgi:hypothetical protein
MLLALYASFAGPPVTREALVEMAQPVVEVAFSGGGREALLAAVTSAYHPLLAEARERVKALR